MPYKDSKDFKGDEDAYFGVIDIGSNSVRLVVFDGLRRHPHVVFNEKVLCGLGRTVGKTGLMDDAAMDMAIATLARFQLLLRHMRISHVKAVATAAVREADNGPDFIKRAHDETGLSIEVISGEEEARLSALGVVAGCPTADGIVGDLGGGSLELVHVENGTVKEAVTLPIGPVRLEGVHGTDFRAIAKDVKAALADVKWLSNRTTRDFYIVGGAWRAISRANMAQKGIPLKILHGFTLSGSEARDLADLISHQEPESLKNIKDVPSKRADIMPVAALILREILAEMTPRAVVTSSLGLREGLVFDHLSKKKRKVDPFLAAAQELAEHSGRFREHGERLMNWIEPVFEGVRESPEQKRLRFGVCLLSDISWRGHPDFRAERAIMEALYGRFVGIDHRGRGFVGLALSHVYGNANMAGLADICRSLISDEDAELAKLTGLALRLGHRVSGGTGKVLKRMHLRKAENTLDLHVQAGFEALANDVVRRRLDAVASLLSLDARFVTEVA